MANTIILKKSGVSGNSPTSSQIALGEIALNYADGLLYYKSGASATPAKINAGDADTVDGYHLNQNVLTTASPSFAGLTVDDNGTTGTGMLVTGGGSGGPLAIFRRDIGSTGASININASNSDSQIQFAYNTNYYSIGIDASENQFKISDNNVIGTNDRLIIDGNGRVGLGVVPDSNLTYVKLDLGSTTNDYVRAWGYLIGDNNSYIANESLNVRYFTYGGSHKFETYDATADETDTRLIIKSDGKVGIGESAPARKLHVSAGNGDAAARFENTSSNGTVVEIKTSGDNKTLQIQSDHILTNTALHLGAESYNTYLRGANIGIGTTSPSSSFKLDVNGSTRIRGSATINGNITTDNESRRLQEISVLPGGYIESSPINFRFDESQTAYAGESSGIGGTITATSGTTIPQASLKRLFTFTENYINLNTYKDASNNIVIELSGISLSNSANTSWKPYVFFHSGASNVTSMTVEVKNGSDTWETVEDAIDVPDFYIHDGFHVVSTGVLKGFRLTLSGITGNSYLRMIGVIGKTVAPYAWNVLKSGSNMYGNLDFGDDYKAQFGNSDDLQIYHDGVNSRITNTTGELRIAYSDKVRLWSSSGVTNLIAYSGGATELYHNGTKQLETTSSAVQVTNLSASTATYSPILYGGSSALELKSSTGEYFASFANNGAANIYHDNTLRLSTESAGVRIVGSGSYSRLKLLAPSGAGLSLFELTHANDENNASAVIFGRGDSTYPTINSIKRGTGTTKDISFAIDSSVKMVVDTDGKVGIGTTSPVGMLSVVNPLSNTNTWTPTNKPDLWVSNAGTSNSYYAFGVTTSSGDILSVTNAGNVGIGTTSPAAKLNVVDSSTIGWSNLANSHILVGTTTVGVGIDTNEIASKGGPLYIGTIDAGDDLIFRAGGGSTNNVTIDGTSGDVTIANNLIVSGDLTVSGDTTIINTETLQVEDHNIELGNVSSPTDLTADGGGITLKGATDKTINWYDATDAWTSNQTFIVNKGTTNRTASLSDDGLYMSRTTDGANVNSISANASNSNNLDIKSRSNISLILNSSTTLIASDAGKVAINNASVGDQKLYVNGDVKINQINAATIDTDKFIVSDAGVIKFRTGSEVLSDIGGLSTTTAASTYLPLSGGVLSSSGSVPLYARSTGTVSYIQIQNSSTGSTNTNDGLTVGCNGTAGYVWLREADSLSFGTNDTTAITIDSSQNTTLAGRLNIGTVDSNTSSTSALVLNGTEVEKRTLGSNAFNSTAYLPLSGGSLTGALDFNSITGRAITITGDSGLDNADASIYLGNASNSYGWDLKYIGSGSGNNNRFDIVSTNSGSPVTALSILQDGKVGINVTDPDSRLEVKSTGSSTANAFRVRNSGDHSLFSVRDDGIVQIDTNYLHVANTAGAYFNGAIRARNGITNDQGVLTITGDVNFDANTLFVDSTDDRVGIGTTTPSYDLQVNGGIKAGGKVTYEKMYGSLDTTGQAVAAIGTASNGASSLFEFTCFGGSGGYQKVVWSMWNVSGTWYSSKVIDEGTNTFDVTYSGGTFTFKARSSTQGYSPRVIVEAAGYSIDNSYA